MKVFLFILLLAFSLITVNRAQKQADAGMWNTITIEKELSKKIIVSVDQEFRLKYNYSTLNLFYTNISLDYKVFKGFKISPGFRFIQKYLKEDYFSFRYRLLLDASYKYELFHFLFCYRSRVQTEIRDYYTSEVGKIPEWYWRNKFDIKYNFNKFVPYIGTEVRYQIFDPKNPATNNGWHRARMYAGIDYKLNKGNSIGIYFLKQQEYDIDDPNDLYIIGLQYALSIGRNKDGE